MTEANTETETEAQPPQHEGSNETLGELMYKWLDDFNDARHTSGRGAWNTACVSWRWVSDLLKSEGLLSVEKDIMAGCYAQTRHMHGTTTQLPRGWMTNGQFELDTENHRVRPLGPGYDDSPPNWFAVEVLGSDLSAQLLQYVEGARARPEAWLAERYLPLPPHSLDASPEATPAGAPPQPPSADAQVTDRERRYAHLSRAQLEDLLDAEVGVRSKLEGLRMTEQVRPAAEGMDTAAAISMHKHALDAMSVAHDKVLSALVHHIELKEGRIERFLRALEGPLNVAVREVSKFMRERFEADEQAPDDEG